MNRSSLTQQHIPQRRVIQAPSQSRTHLTSSLVSNINVSSAPSLPSGWKREEVLKPSGLTAGKTEVYYISPQGRKVRSKQELQQVLGEKYDTTYFDWRTGKFQSQMRNKRPGFNMDGAPPAKVHKSEYRLSLPTRRTALITQTGVSVFRNHPDSKKSDVKHGPQEPPRQIFWEKRLEGGKACDPDTGAPFKQMLLPKGIQSAGGPNYPPDQMIQSLVNSLFNRNNPVTGQQQSRPAFEKNACVAINCEQPLIKQYIVSDDDVRRQESRVRELRRKLETAKKKLEPRFESERTG